MLKKILKNTCVFHEAVVQEFVLFINLLKNIFDSNELK